MVIPEVESTAVGNVVQFTGAGTTSDGYYRITSVPAKNQIAIAKTAVTNLKLSQIFTIICSYILALIPFSKNSYTCHIIVLIL